MSFSGAFLGVLGPATVPTLVAPTTYTYNNRLPNWVNPTRGSYENSSGINSEDRQSTFNAEGGILPIIYGTQRVGSKIFAITQSGDNLVLGVAFCEGPIHSILALDINDIGCVTTEKTSNGSATVGSSYSGNVTVEVYLGSQTATSPILSTAITGYTDILTDTAAGYATVYAALQLSPSATTGFPNITAEIKGLKVYDPRDARQSLTDSTTWTWSNNPALCLADLIRSPVYGLGKTVDWVSVAECANWNDRLVQGTSVARMLDIVLDTQQNTTDWIETLRGYAGCFVVPAEDGFKLIPDKPVGYAASFLDNTTTCELPYSASHEMTNEISLEVSIMPAALVTGTQTILSKGTDYWLDYTHPTGTVLGSLSFSYTDTIAGVRSFTVEGTLPLETFTTFSISIQKNLLYVLAINGVQAEILESITRTPTSTVAIQSSTAAPIFIGQKSGGYFNGKIDEVRLWNRYRTLNEIENSYNKLINATRDSSLVLHLPFNEGTVSIAWDGGGTRSSSFTVTDKTGNVSPFNFVCPSSYELWYQHDGHYDFFNFDGSNIVGGTAKWKRRGAANIPTIVEVSFTDTTRKPWTDNFARADNSIANGGKVRLSTIPMPGITRYSQAYREAVERYNSLNLADTTLSFSALDTTLNLTVGSPIQFHHPAIETAGTFFFKPYRLVGLRQSGLGKWELSAVEYDASIYSNDIENQESYVDTNLPVVDFPPAPTFNTPTEFLRRIQTGVYTSRISWEIIPPSNYPYISLFKVTLYQGTDASGTKLEEAFLTNTPTGGVVVYTSSSNLNLINENLDGLTYYLTVCGISIVRVASPTVGTTITLAGKTAPPEWPVGASLTGFEAGGKCFLEWDEAEDLDVVGYEIRQGDYAALTALGTDTNAQWAAAAPVNTIPGYQYTAYYIPTGTRRFFVKAIDSVRNESATPLYCDMEVDSDNNAFTLDFVALPCSPTASSNISSYTARPNPKTYWVTDFGDTWDNAYGDAFTAALTDTVGAFVVPVPHATADSVWTSDYHDFGTPLSGGYHSGFVTVDFNMTVLSGTVSYCIEHSTDATAWTQVSGSSATLTARYIRFKVTSTGDDGAFVISDDVMCRFNIIIREESGTAVTVSVSGATSYATVSLSRQYSLAQTIQLTVNSSGANNYSAVYDTVNLGSGYSPNTFRIYVVDNANAMVTGASVSYLFKGIS